MKIPGTIYPTFKILSKFHFKDGSTINCGEEENMTVQYSHRLNYNYEHKVHIHLKDDELDIALKHYGFLKRCRII